MTRLSEWDKRFLKLAQHIAGWSKDPSTKVGAVIADINNRIVSTGYNGFPVSVPDRLEWLNDRERKYELIVHGDLNAILFAQRPLYGCTIYTWPFPPCSRCASVIVQVGIKRVVAAGNTPDHWKNSIDLTRLIFNHASVVLAIEGPDNEFSTNGTAEENSPRYWPT